MMLPTFLSTPYPHSIIVTYPQLKAITTVNTIYIYRIGEMFYGAYN